jgi:hypothetical protein
MRMNLLELLAVEVYKQAKLWNIAPSSNVFCCGISLCRQDAGNPQDRNTFEQYVLVCAGT